MSLTKEQLLERKKYIGASDTPAIMGVSPWCTPYQKWLEKVSDEVSTEMTPAMQRGIDLEESARKRFEEMTGLVMFPNFVKVHVSIPFMRASLDGIDMEQKNIVEIKCPSAKTHAMAKEGIVPDHYMPQLQHQIEVCELDMAYYFSFDGTDGVIVKVFRDDNFIRHLVTKETEFWECVQNFTPPKMTEKDYNLRTDDEWSTQASSWLLARKRLKEAEALEDECRQRLILLSQGRCCKGNGIVLNKILRKGAVDYSRIPELKSVNLDIYRKESLELYQIKEG